MPARIIGNIETSSMILEEIGIEMAKAQLQIIEIKMIEYGRRFATGEKDYTYIPASEMDKVMNILAAKRKSLTAEINERRESIELAKRMVEKIANGLVEYDDPNYIDLL